MTAMISRTIPTQRSQLTAEENPPTKSKMTAITAMAIIRVFILDTFNSIVGVAAPSANTPG